MEEHFFILLFILIQLLFNTWAKIYMFQSRYNTVIYQANYISSLAILTAYFLTLYHTNMRRQTFLVVRAVSMLPVIATAIIIATEREDIFNSRSSSFVSVMISLHSIIYYYLKLLKPNAEKITRTPSFWFVTGLFFYYSGSFFIVTTFRLFVGYDKFGNQAQLWLMHNIIFFLMCISFSIGFTCRKYQTI